MILCLNCNVQIYVKVKIKYLFLQWFKFIYHFTLLINSFVKGVQYHGYYVSYKVTMSYLPAECVLGAYSYCLAYLSLSVILSIRKQMVFKRYLEFCMTFYSTFDRNFLPLVSTCVHPQFLVGSELLIFLVFCVVFLVLFVLVLYLVYPMLPVSLDCPFLIASSVFSNVYLHTSNSHF